MLRFLSICALFLGGCDRPTETVLVQTDIPEHLLHPCPGPSLNGIETEVQLGVTLIRYGAALGCANSKIAAISEIVTKAEGPQ